MVLQPLISDLRILATEGITIVVNNVEKTFQGALLLCLGDNLGSNATGGFKQSFSFAFRFCRSCYVTNSEYKSLSESSELVPRCDDKHTRECDLLSGPLCDHYSRINRRSVLMNIQCSLAISRMTLC